MISTTRQKTLQRRMAGLAISDADLIETFVAGSGPGGQKINKTASSVRLHHRPTGIVIQCQEGRSRELNRYLARVRLCERIESDRRLRRSKINRQRARERYRKRTPSKRQKAKKREFKSRRSEKKRFRGKVSGDG